MATRLERSDGVTLNARTIPLGAGRRLPWLVHKTTHPQENLNRSEDVELTPFRVAQHLSAQSDVILNKTEDEGGVFNQQPASAPTGSPFVDPPANEGARQAVAHARSKGSPDIQHANRRILSTSDGTESMHGETGSPSTAAEHISLGWQRHGGYRVSEVDTAYRGEESRGINSAINGLEYLMDQAIQIMGDASSRDHDHSPISMEKTLRKDKHKVSIGPLQISSSSSASSHFVKANEEWPLRQSEEITHARGSSAVLQNNVDDRSRREESAAAMEDKVEAQDSRNVHENTPNHWKRKKPLDASHVKKSKDSIAIDWAYVPRSIRPFQRASSSSSDSDESIVRRPIPHVRPTAPPAIVPVDREHINFVDRKPTDVESDPKSHQLPSAEHPSHHQFIGTLGEGLNRRPANRHAKKSHSSSEWAHKHFRHRQDKPSLQRFAEPGEASQRPTSERSAQRRVQRNSSIGSEPQDGRLGLGEADLTRLDLKEPRRNHHSLRAQQPFSMSRHHRRQPVARDWSQTRKRLTALVACLNTTLLGLLIGIYAGEVPAIQYYIADQNHDVILGNVMLYLGMAVTTAVFWPMPLLHGRRRYILTSLSLVVPLQFPQAVCVQTYRSPSTPIFRTGLLVPRAFLGLALGFLNINCITILLDLFGASLQSKNPHQEIVISHDVRRHGGGLGLWLGFWVWCSIGSLAVGFCIGAGIIDQQNPAWGFYVVVILAASSLLLNVLTPETRRAQFRRSIGEFVTEEEEIRRLVARGEIKLHVSQEGPKWWTDELVAGLIMQWRMISQRGFFIMAIFTAWIYAQIVLVIVVLGALLSRKYVWRAQKVGLGVFAVAVGAFLAIPLSKANIFSRDRKKGPRTDSMTFEHNITWSSHLVRRTIFTTVLPIAGVAYTVTSVKPSMHYIAPIVFAGLIGFLTNLGITECYGLIMETYDTSDLQPGVNSKHRLQSLAAPIRRRRTNYSSYPRVSAGIFAIQSLSFFFAAGATGIGGKVTREYGAPLTTGIWAAILLGLTLLLAFVLWRFKSVKVIPDHTFGTRVDTAAWMTQVQETVESDWKPVVIGNPSGKMRRMNLLEMGRQSRWTEIRKLNKLVRDN
ncbi:MAG: hypothetical protein M1820_007143 [Bogoriella megaspora]|nr:MAG: hypothetical protein M1820_007143 [Bogoriella megaspora]